MAKTQFNSCLISIVCFLLSFLVFVVAEGGSNETEDPKLSLSLVLERLETLENENRELKHSHEELKQQFKSSKKNCEEQFKTLKKELEDLKNENCVGDDVWLLTPPLRGRRGQKGEKGDSTTSALPSKSVTSCSGVMEILPSPRSKKQTIYPHENRTSVEVLCDFETDGGGWTIIQKRTSGEKQEFKQKWSNYTQGFGSLSGNFWIGLENIRALTKNGDQELRIELEDFQGAKRWAKYSRFSVSDASDFYSLAIGGFSGDAGDSLYDVNGKKFSTIDKDNDNSVVNCAADYRGGTGWWFDSGCGNSNLNGLYFEKGETVPLQQGIYWYHWKGQYYSLAKSEMKIRKKKP